MDSLSPEVLALLQRDGFFDLPFLERAGLLAQQGHDPESNRLGVDPELPGPESQVELPPVSSPEHARLTALGEDSLRRGEVGVVVLNGGMATRFGGAVKGALPAVDGRSFLELKLRQAQQASRGRARLLLMNSFATDSLTREHLADLDLAQVTECFRQSIALRLDPAGQLFRGGDGAVSLYATGHGDLPSALLRSGALARFLGGGGRYLTVSNVDNLAASLDPAVIGLHIAAGRPMSVEVVEKRAGDVGGVPARVGGRCTLVEAFRLPRGFAAERIPVFNTNTFVFDAAALEQPLDLDWFWVRKEHEGQPVLQLERLLGQVADHLDCSFLRVPRSGLATRFLPIKRPADLERELEPLRALLLARGVLPQAAP